LWGGNLKLLKARKDDISSIKDILEVLAYQE